MSDHSVSIGLLADTSNFQKGMGDAVNQINSFGAQVEKVSLVGSALKSRLVPVAAAIAAAFGAKTALSAYGESDLPGAKAFTSSIKASQDSLKKLSAAVGEYLAPAAKFAAQLISKIADPLTNLVRQFTAFSRSSAAFLEQLGANFLAAFGAVIPTAKAAVDYLRGLFNGPARDWAADIEWFRDKWNSFWREALDVVAPYLVGAGQAVEFALTNWRALGSGAFDAIATTAANAWGIVKQVSSDAWANLKVIGENIIAVFSAAFGSVSKYATDWYAQFNNIIPTILKRVGESLKAFAGIFKLLAVEAADLLAAGFAEAGSVFQGIGESIGKAVLKGLAKTLRASADLASYVLPGLSTALDAFDKLTAETPPAAGESAKPGTDWSTFFKGVAAPFSGSADDFKAPKFNFDLPGLKELPGFSAVGGLFSGVGGGIFDKLADAFKVDPAALQKFKDTILAGLPGVNATPGAPTVADKAVLKIAATQGTFNPNAVGGLSSENYAKRTADATEEIAKNTRSFGTTGTKLGMGF